MRRAAPESASPHRLRAFDLCDLSLLSPLRFLRDAGISVTLVMLLATTLLSTGCAFLPADDADVDAIDGRGDDTFETSTDGDGANVDSFDGDGGAAS